MWLAHITGIFRSNLLANTSRMAIREKEKCYGFDMKHAVKSFNNLNVRFCILLDTQRHGNTTTLTSAPTKMRTSQV